MRNFYRWILAAHPRAFRERFENEMLFVFEEALTEEGILRLMMDGFFSLLRQRIFRRGSGRNVLQAAPAGPNSLFSSFVGERHSLPIKMSRLIFGAAISFNLFVMNCTLIGRGHALRSDRNASSSGSFQIFRSRIRSGNALFLRGRGKMFPFVLSFQDSAEMDASAVQPGSNSDIWMNIPFQSSSGNEIIYVRMTCEQFARFEQAGTAGVELTSTEGKMQHAYLQIADATNLIMVRSFCQRKGRQ